MPLIVRRVRVTDLPILEQLEQETLSRYPGRKGWMETYRKAVERALSEEPEGILVADDGGQVVGGVIVQQRGLHPVTQQRFGVLLSLTVSAKRRGSGVGTRLLKEAFAYLKVRGCRSLTLRLPADAGSDAQLFQESGFQVVSWELEKPL